MKQNALKTTLTLLTALAPALFLAACNSGNSDSNANTTVAQGTEEQATPIALSPALDIDRTCDLAAYPSETFFQCEAQNVAKTFEANTEQLNPAFQIRSETQQQANRMALLNRFLSDPSWNTPPAFGNTPATPLCAAGMGPCVGDPFRYPGVDGPDGDTFYNNEAEVIPVVYYDQGCARISGHVWRPLHTGEAKLPVVVIKNGSVQASEQLYWWAAQPLVRAGYMVLTSDPRGQGLSDASTPTGEQGGNFNGAVFFEGLVNDIDFVLSSPAQPYPHETTCANTFPTKTEAFNPLFEYVDPDRIGLAGHSYGAGGVTWVQSYGAEGSLPWPGLLTTDNPVKAVVAWDALGSSATPNAATLTSASDRSGESLPTDSLIAPDGAPPVVPNVPALGFTSEYGFTPVAFLRDPERDAHLAAYKEWVAAGKPVMNLTIAGSTHLDYSPGPVLPATSWCPSIENNACVGGWAKPVITHYTLAWFDRWLKVEGEQGYEDADSRLSNDALFADRLSFHFASARAFPDRAGNMEQKDDIRLYNVGRLDVTMPTP